jgi:hypothetical protein
MIPGGLVMWAIQEYHSQKKYRNQNLYFLCECFSFRFIMELIWENLD